MGFLKMMLTFLVLIVMATCLTADELLPISSYLGTHKYERVGYHVHTAGDVNGDGLDDFLVGTFHNRTRGPDSGAAYLILGRASGNWGDGISLNNADARFLGRTWYDAVGYFLGGGGDLNGDGLDDMLIGAPAGNDNVAENPGEVFIVLGRSSANWGDNFCLKNNADGSWLGENGQDLAGISAAFIGDVNADGFDDFICGAAYNDYKTTDGGKVYLILGRSAWSRN
ncbi:FG-GAP repeat protein, partial [bacterium]|nr:FG-GAP repeat protein [bacterium]